LPAFAVSILNGEIPEGYRGMSLKKLLEGKPGGWQLDDQPTLNAVLPGYELTEKEAKEVVKATPQGFPVRFQKAVFNSEGDESVACSPAILANNLAFRALNRFWNFLARRVAVALKVHPFG
jgi:hypothetical protein